MTTQSFNTKIARVWRQLCFMPYRQNRLLTPANKDAFAHAIHQAEQGHRGEIVLIIENHLPIATAFYQACPERANELFALYRVWDTEDNTGILVYVNLCEHYLQIVADRGICAKTLGTTWDTLCKNALTTIKQGDFAGAICTLIQELGVLLQTHFPSDDHLGNELPNRPIYLK